MMTVPFRYNLVKALQIPLEVRSDQTQYTIKWFVLIIIDNGNNYFLQKGSQLQ